MLRRSFLANSVTALALPNALAQLAGTRFNPLFGPDGELAAIEQRVGGRLGVAILDTGTGRHRAYHANDRFPMCSTFKWLLAARVLTRVDRGDEQLDRVLTYAESDLLEYAPVTRQRINEGGMTVSAVAEAAVEYSDNTAANLLLQTVGGPAGFTAWLRTIGDHHTRLDRNEPELNSSVPGDPRDTTTPSAMVEDLRRILLGKVLTEVSRDRLTGWLVANTTGNDRIRAGLPAGWKVGDKTGTGANGSTNDLAIIWPTGQAPVLVAAYLTGTTAKIQQRNAALADVARVVAGRVE